MFIQNNLFLISIAAIVFFIVAAVFTYKQMNVKPFNANYEHGASSSSDDTDTEYELLFFYVDWCPHSKTAKPHWDEFKVDNKWVPSNENGNVDRNRIIFKEINCTDETEQTIKLMNKYNIDGFPTIILLKNNEVIQFDAKPTHKTLSQFLDASLG